MNSPLAGLIAAVHTPMRSDGELNLTVVDQQARYLHRVGVSGVFVAGTTGESHSLTGEERRALGDRWARAAREQDLRLVIHVGHNSQRESIRLAAHAREVGADAVAMLAPSYFKPPSLEELIEFCVPIAAAAGELPAYLYHIPSFTGVHFSMLDFLQQGKPRMPNLAGLKYTSEDLAEYQECLHLGGGEFNILFGRDEALLAGLVLGAPGAVGSTYNFAASLYLRLMDAFRRGDLQEARREQLRSVQMVRIIARYSFASAAKSVMRMVGIDCGPARSPLRRLPEHEFEQLQQHLETLGVLDLDR